MEYGGYTYILTNNRNSVLYIGVTANLDKRMYVLLRQAWVDDRNRLVR